jgi:hypothetical protein
MSYINIPSSTGGGSGDVTGPASSTDNAAVRFDLTTGKLLQNSWVIIEDSNDIQFTTGAANSDYAIFNANNNTGIFIGAGATNSNGPSLTLHGLNHSSNPGSFALAGMGGVVARGVFSGTGNPLLTVGGTTAGSGAQALLVSAAYTTGNTVQPVATLRRTVQGDVGSTGNGSRLVYEVMNTAGVDTASMQLDAVLTDATSSSEDADFVVRLIDAGALTERLRVNSDGNVTMTGQLSVTKADASNGLVITSSTGTNATFGKLSNTGGDFYVGVNDSLGNALGIGSGYDVCFYHTGNKPFLFAPNGAVVLTVAPSGVTIASDTLVLSTAKTPASASAAGTTGQIAWDANFIYVCVATNTWKRSAITTW